MILSVSLGLLVQQASHGYFFLQKWLKFVVNALRASVTSYVIEPDALHGQATYYDVKSKVLCLWWKYYNTDYYNDI